MKTKRRTKHYRQALQLPSVSSLCRSRPQIREVQKDQSHTATRRFHQLCQVHGWQITCHLWRERISTLSSQSYRAALVCLCCLRGSDYGNTKLDKSCKSRPRKGSQNTLPRCRDKNEGQGGCGQSVPYISQSLFEIGLLNWQQLEWMPGVSQLLLEHCRIGCWDRCTRLIITMAASRQSQGAHGCNESRCRPHEGSWVPLWKVGMLQIQTNLSSPAKSAPLARSIFSNTLLTSSSSHQHASGEGRLFDASALEWKTYQPANQQAKPPRFLWVQRTFVVSFNFQLKIPLPVPSKSKALGKVVVRNHQKVCGWDLMWTFWFPFNSSL